MSPKDLVDEAIRSAEAGYEEAVTRLVELAHGDKDALIDAARLLSSDHKGAREPEHIAFTYISAAFRRVAGLDRD